MNDRIPEPHAPKPPLGFLAWIAAYKLFKALMVTAGGLLVLRMIHRDLADAVSDIIESLGINPQSHFATHLIERASRLNPHRLHVIAGVLFFYAVIYVTEGVGLFMEKTWAEWLTVVQTGLLLPWEAYELFRRPSWVKLGILIANAVVVLYLIWRIRRDRSVGHGIMSPTQNGAPPDQENRQNLGDCPRN